MRVTTTDLKKFEQMIRKAYRSQDSSETRLDNTTRGYCLIYNFYADSCAESAEEEAQQITSLILDGTDFIYSLEG